MRLVDYLMGNPFYIGFRVEVASRFLKIRNLVKKYNSSHDSTQIFDLYKDGKITVEKENGMLIAHGAANDKISTGMINFSVMTEVGKTKKDLERLIQIINVLGNDRLIRERVNTFVSGKSMLNSIPELQEIKTAFIEIESLMPGFIRAGWYYAPEARFK